MVKIRLARFGRKNNPFYRIVTTDSRNRRDGSFIQQLGTYEPFTGKITIDEEKSLFALKVGAQPTDTVKSILKKKGIFAKFLLTKQKKKKIDKKDSQPNKTVKK
ncbi:30S ribosomal protein S16 [bacterium]|nr:30S ribosomal protein S16 [bacterium]